MKDKTLILIKLSSKVKTSIYKRQNTYIFERKIAYLQKKKLIFERKRFYFRKNAATKEKNVSSKEKVIILKRRKIQTPMFEGKKFIAKMKTTYLQQKKYLYSK